MHTYVGSYQKYGGKGIYFCEIGKDLTTFEVRSIAPAVNPTYLTRSNDGKTLYAVLETMKFGDQEGGGVAAYEIEEDGSLRLINEAAAGGALPCHLTCSPDGKWLFAANYLGGNVSVFPLLADGSVGERSALVNHTGSGPHPKRQTKPYCHSVTVTPDQTHLCVADLGADSVVLYRLDPEKGICETEDLRWKTAPGAGPRHMVFSPDGKLAYVVCEMGSSIECFSYNGNGKAEKIQAVSTLPPDFDGASTCAAIRYHEGKIYASNRGHDSVSVFNVAVDGTLTLHSITKTGGKTPREIQWTPDGAYLLCGHQDEGGITALRKSPDGSLTQTDFSEVQIPAPVVILV